MILDDAFSGLDRKTEEIIFDNLLAPGGLFRRMGTTVIMTSNNGKQRAFAYRP